MKLPAAVWSQLGKVGVTIKPLAAPTPQVDPDFGGWIPAERKIELHADLSDTAKLATLFHEMAHVALWDAGGENVLTELQKEFVCDAIGSYFAGAVIAGYIKMHAPK